MSPNDGSREYVNAMLSCQVCRGMVSCEFICMGCSAHGHIPCIRLEQFMGCWFCPLCLVTAVTEYTACQDEQRRQMWKGSLSMQVSTWRSRVTEAIGMSSTLGVAVGGAIIAVAGVASGLAHGIARGASIGSNVVQLALPATSEDDFLSVGDSVEADRQGGRPSEEVRLATRSTTVATPRRGGPRCNMCWHPTVGTLRPIVHTYICDCKLRLTSSGEAVLAAAPGSPVRNSITDALDGQPSGSPPSIAGLSGRTRATAVVLIWRDPAEPAGRSARPTMSP